MTRELIAHVMMYSVNRDILVFESAETFIAHLKSGRTVHLVLCEIHLPCKNGFDLLRYVKKEHSGTSFIAMSANPADETPAIGTGADGFLSRPFTLNDLFGIVQRFVVESPEFNRFRRRAEK